MRNSYRTPFTTSSRQSYLSRRPLYNQRQTKTKENDKHRNNKNNTSMNANSNFITTSQQVLSVNALGSSYPNPGRSFSHIAFSPISLASAPIGIHSFMKVSTNKISYLGERCRADGSVFCPSVVKVSKQLPHLKQVSSLCNTAAFLHAKYPWRTRSH